MNLDFHPSWRKHLESEFSKDYFVQLESFISSEIKKGKIVFPPEKEIFSALKLTPFNKVKAVIIGQDPYHGPGQAHGLSFSVKPDVKIPPSLKNIYKELHQDLGIGIPDQGYLISWAEQGVLLLNSVLTVESGSAGSHQKKGWEIFTDKIVSSLNDYGENLVFFLWGSHAQKKGSQIDRKRHLILEAVHPSPLSAHRGFFGCRHFSKANNYLEKVGKEPINWVL